MPDINGRTLMMAIQAVDFKIHDLVRQLEQAGDQDGGDLEMLLLSYEKAATALKSGYEEALKSTSNLPAYDTLVDQNE